MHSSAVARIADATDQRLHACSTALENLLRDDPPILLASARELGSHLAARREYRLHRIALTGGKAADVCAALGQPCQPELRINLNDDQTLQVRIIESTLVPPDLDGSLAISDSATPLSTEGLRNQLSALLASAEYRSRYRNTFAKEVVETDAALRQHCRLLRASSLARRELIGRQNARLVGAGSSSDRTGLDALRTEIADSLGRLNKSIVESLRRSLGPEG